MSGRPRKKSSGNTFDDFRREILDGKVQPLYLFVGEEQYLQQHALKLLQETIDESIRVFNVSVFAIGSDNGSGIKTTVAMAIDAANQMPMISSRRIVVIRDFDKIKEDEQELVLSYLKRPAATTTLVFQAVSPDKRRKLTAALFKHCAVISFDLLARGPAIRWAGKRLKDSGCSIEPDALQSLIDLTGTGLTRLANELDKLSAYADGGTITSAAVRELVPRASEHNNWELWDAINSQNRRRTLTLTKHLLDDNDPLPILGSLASLYRRLLTGKELVEQGATLQEVKSATGQWSNSFLNRVRRASRAEIVRGLKRIAEVDNAIKNSEGTPRLQLEYLIVELMLQNRIR
ncbi:MAG TPA: DNA polymerase III subunit delta [Blastocatellia bacterium]|nr:DNA polymerase III subunit delta [Blastocatellia bacterium]